ncbi:protein kinase [Candidatus Uabimicrobium amorphum]|uniref:Protein kinase n=2 Tax=Uabimicrobium amorphum TaxID=2596890 RepID=A0A5S9IIM9_UABAM|nr:protein kinase [Candidatus Uabimicrobium amorphum]
MLNNRYQVLEKLGEGSMGVVCRALDKSNNRLVAIKQCTLSTKNDKNVERFKREYQFLSQNQHKNIVKAYDLFRIENRYYLVLEYIRGITLGDLIFEHPRSILFSQQLEIAIQICDGVKFLNNRGIVHRDLKPDNIILTENYVPKILDMGIAKSQMRDMDSLTSAGKVVGTISYMSPEQFSHKDSNKIDVFSLAILFYQFFAWLPGSPFKGKNFSQTMHRILKETLPCFSIYTDKNNLQHKTVGNFLQLAMQKNPTQRIDINKLYFALCNARQINNIQNLYNHSNNLLTSRTNPRRAMYIIICTLIVLTAIFVYYIPFSSQPTDKKTQNTTFTKSLEHLENLHNTGKYTQAIQHANTMIEKGDAHPLLYRVYSCRAAAYYRNGMRDNAIRDFHQVLQLNDKALKIYVKLGALYAQKRLFNKSLQQFNAALRIKPDYAAAYYYRGITYALMKQKDKAQTNFKIAVRLDKRYMQKIHKYYREN